MRVAAINDIPVRNRRSRFPAGERPERWAVRREYRSTFRDTLVSSEQLTAGEWRGNRTDGSVPPVSLEEGIAEDLRVGVGDRITWDVQGVQITTRVASLREVDWARLEPNFFAVFPTAVLEDAPQTWIYLARTSGPQARAVAQRDVTGRFSNVASVDLTQVQATLDEVLGRVSATIRFLAGFSILTGFVVLLGAVAVGRLQRIRESVLLRTLGAARRQIGAILLTEYALLGLLASVCGAGLAVVAGWALAQWLWELPFVVPVGALLGLAAAVTVLAAVTGFAASREVFRHTPLEALREE
jgi:putative ABC transport system permease protein